ncbi:hypothetical protein BX666DRAFT_2011300 [Dichotomocladium elegans]|nr:hypothetical protein BX666DRAFT_2011300 [Dichotomocladium elegans]
MASYLHKYQLAYLLISIVTHCFGYCASETALRHLGTSLGTTWSPRATPTTRSVYLIPQNRNDQGTLYLFIVL